MTDPRGIRDPDLPGSPYYNTPMPPKSAPHGGGGGNPFIAQTVSEQAIPLPICYGTMKVPASLVDKFAPQKGDPPAHPGSGQVVAAGQFVQSDGKAYKTAVGGITGSGTPPTGTGTGITDGSVSWDYVQGLPCTIYTQSFSVALCEGEIGGALQLWYDKETLASYTSKGFVLFTGPDATNQTPLIGTANGGYQHTALLQTPNSGLFTGTQAEIPALALEVQGLRFGAATPDASPADIVNDILTSFRRGAGWSAARVDASITGTAAGGYRVYCDAAGFRFSMLLDSQRSVLAWLSDILTATNSDAVWSQGALKIKPLGDQALPAPVYGATGYVPANAAVYNLSTDDFLDKEQPVQYSVQDDADTFNRWPVQYIDRQLGYTQQTVDFPDQANADQRGVRDSGTVNLPLCFPDGKQPVMLSKILAQRSLRVTTTYTFRLDWRYILAEPTDVVTLTEDFSGLLGEPVRIVEMEEQDDGTLLFTAESYPAGVAAATGYQPQTGSGYVSNDAATTSLVPTTVDGTRVGIQNGVVTSAHGTGSSYPDNLWLNPGSESNPPAGADTARPEWAGRFNAGAGAFSGSWVRQLSTAIHARVLLGDQQASAATDQSQLGYFVPCSPGDQFYIEAQCKLTTATAGENAGVYTWFLDASNAVTGGVTTYTPAVAPAASWTKVTAFGTAPAGTVKVMIGLFANCALGAVTAQFDAIYARRADLAPLDHARTVVAPYTFSNAWERLLKAIDGEASASGNPTAGLAFYRGGVDTTSNGGAPLIYDGTNFERVTLAVFGSCGNVTLSTSANWAQVIPLQITIQPKTNLDNLDALRIISLKFYSSAGTFREEIRIPITDRAYGSAGSPGNALNAIVIRQVFLVPGAQGDFTASTPFHFDGYIRVALYNAYGVSDSLDFGPDGNTAGANMSAHATIPGVSGTLSSGGGGSNYCPAPEALILLEDGTTVLAASLRDGMRVQGFQDKGTGAPAIGTIHYAAPETAPVRYLLTLTDGRTMHFSKDHRLWSVTKAEWVVVQQLSHSEEIQGVTSNAFVASVADDGPGPVIGFVVEGTHTYFSDGLLSHNVKSSVP